MTAYKQYNNYLKQWETFTTNNSRNSGFEQTPVRSQFNAELAERVADAAQARYDLNSIRVMDVLIELYKKLEFPLQKNNDDLTRQLVKGWKNELYNKCFKNINYENYDLGNDNTTQWLINQYVECSNNYYAELSRSISESINKSRNKQ